MSSEKTVFTKMSVYTSIVVLVALFYVFGEKDLCPDRRGSPGRPGLATKGAGPDAISTGPSHYFSRDAQQALSSDWSIRETIVSGVSSAPTA